MGEIAHGFLEDPARGCGGCRAVIGRQGRFEALLALSVDSRSDGFQVFDCFQENEALGLREKMAGL